jgi:hypothetical protein
LCLSLFSWASFRQRKGGVKMHMLLDHDSHIPAFLAVNDECNVSKLICSQSDSNDLF